MVSETLPRSAQSNAFALTGLPQFLCSSWRRLVLVTPINGPPMSTDSKQLAERFAAAKVVVVDDEHYMRKVVRTMLMSIGVRKVHEAPDGQAGLELIRTPGAGRRHPRLANARARRPRFRAHRALARDLPVSERADHHAHRPWRALARGRGREDRRQRIPAQAGVVEGAAGPHGVRADQAARGRQERRLLRPGAAQAWPPPSMPTTIRQSPICPW